MLNLDGVAPGNARHTISNKSAFAKALEINLRALFAQKGLNGGRFTSAAARIY